ncbi:transporter substrate-binding domain-containing protein [Vibrio sp. 10N.261.55.A7]|uniref:substrate-binding periplasmic protein n=1 Tax=Vibrio sp. 10N.261.55.A7 TaxID=1880851 RepID=UPI000C854B63|nr:transporter substrate-binding domain-containing protein [Vibrio sp. 10N.261.55.A7]PMJ93128.1 hypothetical protein BCU12_05890 [Vibrio sp. 10N.261.55.A7]
MDSLRITLAVLLLSIASTPSFADSEKVIKLTSGDWLPYTSSQPGGGLVEKVVAQAFKTQGYDVQIDYLPWMRSAKLVEHSHYDATFPWYSSEERREVFTYSANPLLSADTLIFHHKDVDLKWNEISDLGKYKVGGVEGFFSTQLLNENGVETVKSASSEETILKLFYKRVEAIPIAKQVGLHLIRTMPEVDPEMIKINEKPLISKPLYILFAKTPRGKYLSEVFDSGLTILIENGCYDRLMSGESCE